MTKRKHGFHGHGGVVTDSIHGITLHRPHRGIRQHRPAKRMRHSQILQMEVTHEANKHRKEHEARLIPGVDGRKIFGFPNTIISKLRYCSFVALTSTTGSIGTNILAANGIFDPDISGTGHQPLYRDTYAGIYDQYIVLGAKVTARFQPRTTDKAFCVGIVGDDDTTFSTTIETRCEQNNSVWALTGTPHYGPVTLTATFSPEEMFGIAAKDDGSSQTAVGSNPSELFCWALWATVVDNVSTAVIDVWYEIDYTVKFTELQTPTQS